jgi:hypothetical protein
MNRLQTIITCILLSVGVAHNSFGAQYVTTAIKKVVSTNSGTTTTPTPFLTRLGSVIASSWVAGLGAATVGICTYKLFRKAADKAGGKNLGPIIYGSTAVSTLASFLIFKNIGSIGKSIVSAALSANQLFANYPKTSMFTTFIIGYLLGRRKGGPGSPPGGASSRVLLPHYESGDRVTMQSNGLANNTWFISPWQWSIDQLTNLLIL